MRKILILVGAWIAIWATTRVLPPISPGWLLFLPVLYPTYSLIIRRRDPGVQRTLAATLTILCVFITFEWAMSHVPRGTGHLFEVTALGHWRLEIAVYEGRCYSEYWAQNGVRRHDLPPAWVLFAATAAYPAFVLWRVRRIRDRVRDIALISVTAGILFVGILAQLTKWPAAIYAEVTSSWLPGIYTSHGFVPARDRYSSDPLVDILVLPPGFLFLGTIVGAFWFVPAVIMLWRRPFAPAAKTILLSMSVSAVVFSIASTVISLIDGLPLGYVDLLPTLAALALGSVVFFVTCVFMRRRLPILYQPGHCLRCGYDLTGNVSGVCPECGRTTCCLTES